MDPALAQGLYGGDAYTLAAIYRVQQPVVSRFVRRELRRWQMYCDHASSEVDDLVHEVFMRAFRPAARRSYDPTRAYEPFLFAIARNVVTDHLRACRREERLHASLVGAAPHAATAPEGAPLEPAAARDLFALRRARQVLGSLPQRQRELFRVRFEEDTSQRAAAKLLGLSYQETRTLELALLRHLRSLLRPSCTPPGLFTD